MSLDKLLKGAGLSVKIELQQPMKPARRAALALAAFIVAVTASAGTADATTYVKPNAGYASEPMPSYKNDVPVAKPLWSTKIGRPGEQFEYGGDRAATGDGKVFYMKDGVLTAANARTGKVVWTYGKQLQQPVVFDGGDVFVFGNDGTFHRIDAATGKAKWTYRLFDDAGGTIFASPPVFDGESVYLYVLGGLFALDRETGRLIWENPLSHYGGGLLIAGDLLLASTIESGAITVDVTYAVDKRTGETAWRSSSHPSPLLIADGRMYAQNTWPASDGTTHQFRLDEVDLDTGETIEQRSYVKLPDGADPLYHQSYTAAADETSIFVQARDGTIYRYDYRLPGDAQQPKAYQYPGRWIAGPYNNKLFFENEGGRGITALKLTDRNRISYEWLDNPVSRLDFQGVGMFVGQTDGQIYALDVTTGKALFRYRTDARNFDPFHVVDGILLVQAEEMLYAFELPQQLLKTPENAPLPGIDFTKADAKLVIDGVPQVFDPSPVMIDNRMYVPLRALFEAAGANVHYDAASNNVYVRFRDNDFTAPEGVNIYGTVYIPVREAGEALGVGLEWDAVSRTVIMDTTKSG